MHVFWLQCKSCDIFLRIIAFSLYIWSNHTLRNFFEKSEKTLKKLEEKSLIITDFFVISKFLPQLFDLFIFSRQHFFEIFVGSSLTEFFLQFFFG